MNTKTTRMIRNGPEDAMKSLEPPAPGPRPGASGAGSIGRRLIVGLVTLGLLASCTGHGSPQRSTDSQSATDGDAEAERERAQYAIKDGVLPLGVPFQVKVPGETTGKAFSITTFGPLAVVSEPSDYGPPYYRLGMKVEIRPLNGDAELQLDDFSIGPSSAPDTEDDGRAHPDQSSSDADTDRGPESSAAIDAACKGLVGLDAAARRAGSRLLPDGAWSLNRSSVKPFTGCLTFRYQGTPNGFAYLPTEHETEGSQSAWWPLRLPERTARAKPKVLAQRDGSVRSVFPVRAAAGVSSVKVCWSMTGSARNVIEAAATRAGPVSSTIASAVGPTGGCRPDVPRPRYLRIVSSGDWSITITNF